MTRPHLSTGTLCVVSTPLGPDDDLSIPAIRALQEATLIVAEHPSHTKRLLRRHGITTPVSSYDLHDGKLDVLVARLRGGDTLALAVDSGTPAICDPGQALVDRAHRAGIPVRPVAAGSAVIAAAACSGLPGDGFLFVGSAAAQRRERALLGLIAEAERPVVILFSGRQLRRALAALAARMPARLVLLACDMMSPDEWIRRGTPRELLAALGRRRVREITMVVDRKISRRRVSGL